MTKDERKEQKRKEAFRKWARQHAKLRRNLRKHGGDILGGSADTAGTGYYPEAYVAADPVPHPALSGGMGRDDCG